MPKILHNYGALRGSLLLVLAFLSFSVFGQLSISVNGDDISCFGLSSGTATATVSNGVAPFNYAWSNGGTTRVIDNLNAGPYRVTVTDANGSSGSGSIILTEPTRVTATITNPSECNGPFTISADPQGGVLPYTYNWSTGADTRVVRVPAGDYCVTVVDNNLCGYVACTSLNPDPPTVTLVDVDVSCSGTNDGTITANPSGGVAPYTYAWTGGLTGRTISGLSPGTYRVTLTDGRGCTATAVTSITESTRITGQIFGDATVCPGVVDAFIRIAPAGGTPPYTYNWSPGGSTSQGIGALGVGTYSVTVTDANGCTLVDSYQITESPSVDVNISGDLLLCGAGATGTISVRPDSGPVSQYTYRWSTGATSPSISNVGAGNYSVTATDVNGCTGTATARVSTVDLDLDLTSTPLGCAGENNGTATASPTGGNTPYTYLWSNGGTTATISNLASGVYSVTVTEDNNCKVSGNVVVSAPQPLNISTRRSNISCSDANDGDIDVTVTGGTGNYTYRWNDGASTQDRTNLAAGSYSVTVTDDNGCTASRNIQITAPTEIIVSANVTNIRCNNERNGSIRLTVTGGSPNYSYNWSNGATSRDVSNLDAGNYRVTVTDANECEVISSYQITEPSAIVATGVATNVECFGDADGSINLTVSGGSPDYSYNWNTGANTQDISGLSAGNYSVTVTDANNCGIIRTFSITEPTELDAGFRRSNVSCAGAGDGAINVTVTGGTQPYTYRWSNGATTEDLSNLTAGPYMLTVTDANGCTDNINTSIAAPSQIVLTPTVDNVSCADDDNGSIRLTVRGGTPNYAYMWSNGSTRRDITGLSPGSYSVTVTDANECAVTATYTVTAPSALVVTGNTTNIDCFGDTNGAINLSISGGTPGYSFSWNNGDISEDLTNLTAGTYRVTVVDANECTVTRSFTIVEPTDLRTSSIRSDISCAGEDNGSINASATGGTLPYTYRWSNGANTEDIDNLTAGSYTLTVTDANGCTAVRRVTINEPSPLVTNADVNPIACSGDDNGSINLMPSGGTSPYSFDWSNGATTEDISGLTAGIYVVTITDANECAIAASYTVTAPSALVVTGNTTNIDCFGEANGAINLSVSGGTPGYSISWSNGATSEDLTNLTAGSYRVTVVDANECTVVRSFMIVEPTDLRTSSIRSDISCAGEGNGSINATATGGTLPYTYRWSNGASTEDIDNLTAGSYSLTVTDANGCTSVRRVTISEPSPLTTAADVDPVACSGDATGSINLMPSGGTSPYSFDWSNGATTEDISGLMSATYVVTITDANECAIIQTYRVGSVDGIVVTGTVNQVSCNNGSDGSINLTVSGGSAPYAFVWSNGATVEDISGLTAGNYSVVVTDANECTTERNFTVTDPDTIDLTVTAPSITCGGTNSGVITVFPSGGSSPYTYRWSNGATGNTIDNIAAGTYTVTVTDANGCTDVTSSIVLSELPQLTCAVVVESQSTDGTNGRLSVATDGGTAPFTYRWSNGSTAPTISNLASGTYSVTVTDANGCTTECTGTLRGLAGLGDFVFVDLDGDGQQDAGEPGVPGYTVFLKNEAGEIIGSTVTDANGNYSFMGLEPGTYSVLFPELPGFIRTTTNTGNDATDSDADPAMDGMTNTYTLSEGEFDMTVDAGFLMAPGSEVENECTCLNNNTNDSNGQFTERLVVTSNTGQTWRVTARTLLYSVSSPAPPLAPILLPIGTILPETGTVAGDPTQATYSLDVLLVDSRAYSVTVSNGIMEMQFSNQCFYPEVRFRELPPNEICRFEDAFQLEGFGRLNGAEISGTTTFTINGATVTQIDPMSLAPGAYTIVATFVPADSDECEPSLERDFVITDNCNAKLGDFVWQDTNGNGQQDPGEPGIEGVKVTVTSQDGSYMDMAFTDDMGMYMFSVPPGTYKITFDAPDDFVPTTANTGNDATDSDVDPGMMMTGFYTVGPNEMDFTIDAGFINPCAANIVNPGTIGASQEVCGPGNIPQPLFEITPGTGGVGVIEYLWMSNTVDPTQPISFWQPIPNSNSPNFAPGIINETTYFTRCIRRNNCNYIESNYITIEVGDDAVADISGPNVVCVGEEAVFQAVNPGNGAFISWSFTGSSAVATSTDATVTTRWSTFGSFSATLTVTANGCTSTRVFNVSVLNNPNRCGNNLVANGAINNARARDVTIEWEVPADGTEYAFVLERSTDGENFTSVADVTEPAFVSGNDMAMFRQSDISPLAGRTFYRVRMVDAQHGDLLSNVVEMQLATTSSDALGRIFPNPASNGIIHVEMTEMSMPGDEVIMELFDAHGNTVSGQVTVDPGTGVINLPSANSAAGIYFLRITRGGDTETHRVIIN